MTDDERKELQQSRGQWFFDRKVWERPAGTRSIRPPRSWFKKFDRMRKVDLKDMWWRQTPAEYEVI